MNDPYEEITRAVQRAAFSADVSRRSGVPIATVQVETLETIVAAVRDMLEAKQALEMIEQLCILDSAFRSSLRIAPGHPTWENRTWHVEHGWLGSGDGSTLCNALNALMLNRNEVQEA